jgi:hypothetical protein
VKIGGYFRGVKCNFPKKKSKTFYLAASGLLVLTAEIRLSASKVRSSISVHECSSLLVHLIVTEVRLIVRAYCARVSV